MSKFVILLGGHLSLSQRLKNQIAGARVIAADGGMIHAEKLGLMPELWVGDFDSSSVRLQKQYAQVARLQFATEKDATDGEIAVAEAMRRGATEIILVGGLGGQLDHTLAHAGFVVALTKRGLPIFMTSGHEEAHALVGEVEFDNLEPDTRISIVPMSDLKALSISGVTWPLFKRDVPLGSALTLSNIVTGVVRAELLFGSALILIYPKVSE